jgi:hypothetical protein
LRTRRRLAGIAENVTSALLAWPQSLLVKTQSRSDCRGGYAPSAHFRDCVPAAGGRELRRKLPVRFLLGHKASWLKRNCEAIAEVVMPLPHISVIADSTLSVLSIQFKNSLADVKRI